MLLPEQLVRISRAGFCRIFYLEEARGLNVIVINELDKAHPDFAKAMMEMLDSGKLQGGDGKTYSLGKSLIVLTTNKGDDRIFPRDSGSALTREDIEKRLTKFSDKDIKSFFLERDPNHLYDSDQVLPPAIVERIDRAVPARSSFL